TQTRAPWPAKQRAMASPIPEPAPVTSAVLPSSLNMGGCSFGGWDSAEAVHPRGVGVEYESLLAPRKVGEQLLGHAEPHGVGHRELHHRPVAPEEEALRAKGLQQLAHNRDETLELLGRRSRLGHEA